MSETLAKVSATEANREFSKLFRRAKAGETIIITDRGEEVVVIGPKAQQSPEDIAAGKAREEAAWKTFIARLKSQPAQNLPRMTREEMYEDE